MFRSPAIFLVLFLLHLILGADLKEGDACQVARSGVPGICKTFVDCPTATNESLAGRFPAHCGWKGTLEVVCCQNPTTTTPRPVVSDRISVRKCMEYEKAASEITMTAPELVPIEKKTSRCWLSNELLQPGLHTAQEKEFPHMASFGFLSYPRPDELTFGCSGSLISDRFVLTAATCILTPSLIGPPKLVRFGEIDRNIANATVIDIDIEETIPHPSYKETKQYNNIGLIKMAKSVEFTQSVRPACLSVDYSTRTSKAIVAGWRKPDYRSIGRGVVLLKVTLDLYEDGKCRQNFLPQSRLAQLSQGIDSETQFCASSRQKDVCENVSGEPIQVEHPHIECMHSIIGVTTFGKRCSETHGATSVYARVYAYLDWIEGVVWPSNGDDR